MINLLGANEKKELRSARLNTALLRYVFIAAVTLAGVILLALFSWWWLANRIAAADAKQQANLAQTAQYAPVTAKGVAFGSNLAKIQAVIANRSHYGTALVNIAAALPSGVSIESLELSSKFLTTPLKLTVTTRDYQSALAVKQQLADSKAFKSVSLDNADCPGGGSCTVNITATLADSVLVQGNGS